MRIKVSGANAHRKRTFNLCSQFNFDFLRLDVLVFFPVMMEVSVFVQKTGHFVRGSYRPPTVINSLTLPREMQSGDVAATDAVAARVAAIVASGRGAPTRR